MKRKILNAFFIGGVISLTSGCAVKTSPVPEDPLEPLNRGIYQVNKVVDKLYINPVSMIYKASVPPPVQGSVKNIIFNLGEVPTMANDILQGKPKQFVNDLGRFVINSTLGIAGVFDIASEMGLPKHKEDLGQTLAKWGYKDSSYLVLPILGPSTVRDTIGMVGNTYMSLPKYFKPKYRNAYMGTRVVSTKADIAGKQKLVESAGVDEYSLVRATYLQFRDYDVDGGDNTDTPSSPGAKPNNDMLGEPPD